MTNTRRHSGGLSQRVDRRTFLRRAALLSGFVSLGSGSYLLRPNWAQAASPIKVGVATDITGPISIAGIANANIAKLAIQEINDAGGLLGRPLELYLEDTASNESIGVAKARKLVSRDNVNVVLGGITSSMRNAIKDPIVKRGQTLYIYPELYEGKECTPYLFCTGPTPAQQVEPLVPWLIKNGGRKFYLPGADYVWPHVTNAYARQVIEQQGGEIVGEEYFPLDATDYSVTVHKIMSGGVDVVFTTIIPPGIAPFIKQLYEAGFLKRGGRLSQVAYDENALNISPAHEIEGLASCLDYYRGIDDPFSAQLQAKYDKTFPGNIQFTAGGGATGMYRGIKLWEAAVREAGSLDRKDVAAALDHTKIDQGPGGPAEMVPGTFHAKMNMYLAVAKSGKFEIVEQLGQRHPRECIG